MNAITTTLTTSGNSVAVRLPKELLRMSGLTSKVTLEAKQGKIIISKPANPREGWSTQIKTLVATQGEPTQGFDDLNVAAHDGLEELPWNGPSFEDWQKANAKDA
jgi:antitoxin component of MazEF toxin-antitoxin module